MTALQKMLKTRRQLLGLSQSALGHAAGVSLPTIQNIEAGKANPGVDTLDALFKVLGLELRIASLPADWGQLAALGAPISNPPEIQSHPPSPEDLLKQLKAASLELADSDLQTDPEAARKKDALQALLLAIQSHYPTFYRDKCLSSRAIAQMAPVELTGRLVKLKRQALGRISEYL